MISHGIAPHSISLKSEDPIITYVGILGVLKVYKGCLVGVYWVLVMYLKGLWSLSRGSFEGVWRDSNSNSILMQYAFFLHIFCSQILLNFGLTIFF